MTPAQFDAALGSVTCPATTDTSQAPNLNTNPASIVTGCVSTPAPTSTDVSSLFIYVTRACGEFFTPQIYACESAVPGDVNPGGTCSYSNPTLAYNCDEPLGGAGSYDGLLGGDTNPTMTLAQMATAFESYTCAEGSNTTATSGGAGNTGTATAGAAGSTIANETSFTSSVNSALGAIASEQKSFNASSQATSGGSTGSAGSAGSAGSSCVSPSTLGTLSTLVATLGSASTLLSSANVSPSVVASIQALVDTITQTLLQITSCTNSSTSASGSANTTTATANSTVPTQPVTITQSLNPDLGVYIWGKQYDSSGNGPIVDAVNFAAAKGFQSIRLALSPRSGIDYGFSNSCDTNDSLTQIASGSQFQQALSNPAITTIMLTAYDHTTFSDCLTEKFLNPSFYTATNTAAVELEYQNLTAYLYQKYAGTNKTFIISNWEGDNQLYCGDAYDYATNSATASACNQKYASEYNGNATVASSTQGMIDWLNARDAGIAAGRAAAVAQGLTGVSVYSAAEFNIVHALHDNGYASVLYNVLPALTAKPDYISYSSYESINTTAPGVALGQDIPAIEGAAGTSKLIIGEYGYNQTQVGSSTALADMKQVVGTIKQSEVPYSFAWQLFDQTPAGMDFGLFGDTGQPELYNAL